MRRPRALFLIVLTTIVLVVPASRAFADLASSDGAAAQTFTCVGKVTSASQSNVTITVRHASLALRGALGQQLSLTVTTKSALTVISHGKTTTVAAASVPVGDMMAVQGTIDVTSEPGTTLFDVVAASTWKPRVLSRFLCVGTVTWACPQPNAQSLVVTVGRGSSGLGSPTGARVTIDVPASVGIYVLQHRLASTTTFDDLTRGDLVQVTGTADRTDASVPLFTASGVLPTHVAPVHRLKWFACDGVVDGPGPTAGTLLVTLTCGTRAVRADVGAELTLTATSSSVVHTLSNGVLTTLPVADVTAGDSIAVTGTIDRSVPAVPVFDIGKAFVWPATTP
jgi:hypothetical protein